MEIASRIILCFGAIILGFCQASRAQTPAFPGALGFGANATGGRSGTVYHVTTLADSGTGSFRDAVSHSGRIIVFDVGGTITLNSSVSCSSSLTIAGQTAPGGGIAIIGHEVSFSAKQNEIVRFIRIRPGSMQNLDEDAINVGDGTNMIFDHVSLEFAGYNNIDAHGNVGSDNITVQNSIIGDPMSNGTEAKQGFGAHTEHLGGKMAWYYNVWVSEHNRQPLAKIDTIFVNNTEYNFQAGYTVADTSGNFRHDIINNYFITGPTDPSGGRRVLPDERQSDDLPDRQFTRQQQQWLAQRQFRLIRAAAAHALDRTMVNAFNKRDGFFDGGRVSLRCVRCRSIAL